MSGSHLGLHFPGMWIGLPAAALLAAWALLLLGVEPVPTWFYVFAWYPTLFLLDGLACRLDRSGHLLAHTRLALSLFAWSAPIWLVFEAINFRLANWYYIYLPRAPLERWAGILLSFATVVPAVVLAERLWDAAGVGRRWRTRPLRLGAGTPGAAMWIGWIALAAVLLAPRWLYPLTWGALLLVADPIVYRRRPDLSLLADLERGQWGRVARLMLGGLLIGGIWEGYNFVARGRWIYTVPLLEELKWFEMPPLGFVGFPLFALEAWAMYHALSVLGLAVPARGDGRRSPAGGATLRRGPRDRSRSLAIALATAAFCVAVLLGMERWTISSTVPVVEMPTTGVPPDSAAKLVERARLVTLRGIGTRHADELAGLGVTSVCRLATADPTTLWQGIHERSPGRRPTEPEVRVWIRAARRACRS